MIKFRKLELDGETLPNLYVGGELEIPFFNEETETFTVPGRPGSVKKDRITNEWKFPLTLVYRNRQEQLNATEIGNKVVRFIDKGLSRIRITDQDWHWNGNVDGPFNIPIDTNGFAEFEIQITLTDPYRYSQDTYKNTAVSDAISVLNNGTKDTPFEVQATALKNASYFLITDVENNHFMIGEDSEEVTIKDYSPKLLTDEFTSLVGFSRMSAQQSIPDRYLGGATGGKFDQNPQSWQLDVNSPTQSSGWRGAAYSKSFTRTSENFKSTFKVNVYQREMGSGKIGQFIYDDNNKLMFSVGYQNVHTSKDSGRILFMAYNEAGEEKMLWGPTIPAKLKKVKILTIYFELIRQGQQIKMRYWCYDDTNPNGRNKNTLLTNISKVFNDSGNFYQRKIASTRFGIFRGNGNHRPLTALGVYMYELLDKPTDARDMIIKEGDLIVLDTEEKSITVNGTPMLHEKSMSSDYFDIETGLTELLISPTETFDTTIRWKDRYK